VTLAVSGSILVSIGEGPAVEMIAVAPASFVRASDGVTVTVERDADGKVIGLRAPDGELLPRDK
jgi:hypothetical protein